MKTLWWCALCVAAGSCAWWQAARYVVPFIAFKIQEKLRDNHDTLLCRASEQCSLSAASFAMSEQELAMNSVLSPDLSVEENERMFALLEKRIAERGQKGSRPLIVHVGPADLDSDDLEVYRRLSAALQAAKGQVAFVEPHPFLRAKLQQRVRSLPEVSPLDTQVMPVAVCPKDSDAVLYKISDRFFRDFKETGWLYLLRYWAGLDRAHLNRELEIFCNNTGKVWIFKALHVFPKDFPSTLEAWQPYIEELPTRCLSPGSLLREAKSGPESVEVLIVDAEGYDVELVNMFLAMGGFAPSAVMFEWHLHASNPAKMESLVKLARELHARGYDVHRHNHDVIAMLP